MRRRRREKVERPRRVGVRYTEEEHAAVAAAAARVGLTTAGYVSEVALQLARGTTPPAPSPLREAMGDLARNQAGLARIGNNLNQVAAAYNATGELPPEIATVLRLVGNALGENADLITEVQRRLP